MATYLYCSDEDLLIRAPGDLPLLATPNNRLAVGEDGEIAPTTPWQLHSDTTEFPLRGIEAGHLVILDRPGDRTTFGGAEVLVVGSVTGTDLVLRRAGWGDGIGHPPGPATGLAFHVTSFVPQIANASYRLQQAYGIDEKVFTRSPGFMYDARELIDMCVNLVLLDLYMDAQARPNGDVWKDKAAIVSREIDGLAPLVRLRWGPSGQAGTPSGRASTRVSR